MRTWKLLPMPLMVYVLVARIQNVRVPVEGFDIAKVRSL
jgi:hypothetical protein